MLTDAKVAAAVRDVSRGKRSSATLADPAPRGAGRLVMLIKPGRSEWYAQRFVAGRRRLQKLGTYPAMTLAEAREQFAGHKPATGRATLGDLLDAYLATLEGRPSHKQAKSVLASAKAAIGAGRLARDIKPADVAAFIKPVFRAGKRPMAAKRRMYLSAAFRWAIQSANDYRTEAPRDWGLTHNPVSDVPQDMQATKPGERFLSPKELVSVLRWAMAGKPGSARYAIALMLLTGQRVSEILRIQTQHWDAAEKTLHWPTTKNGKPHTIPVCDMAADLLAAIKPGAGGYLFPGNDGKPRLCVDAVRAALLRGGYAGSFCARDFRRTWKTLAGQAGVTKYVRDLLQNHGQTGISSKHYDRWLSMPDKRAGIEIWQGWLREQARQHDSDHHAEQVVDGKKDGDSNGVDFALDHS